PARDVHDAWMRALVSEPEQRDREAVGTVEVRLQRRLDRREIRGRAGHAEVAADARVVHEHVQPAGITAHLSCRLRDTARAAHVGPASGAVAEVLRRSAVTRLGEGVDASGSLAEHAIERVMHTLADYRRAIDSDGVSANVALLTAAVREAGNGEAFAARVRDEFQLDTRVLSGEDEARLTFLGATADQRGDEPALAHQPTLVIDIGGGSTEFVIGR